MKTNYKLGGILAAIAAVIGIVVILCCLSNGIRQACTLKALNRAARSFSSGFTHYWQTWDCLLQPCLQSALTVTLPKRGGPSRCQYLVSSSPFLVVSS